MKTDLSITLRVYWKQKNELHNIPWIWIQAVFSTGDNFSHDIPTKWDSVQIASTLSTNVSLSTSGNVDIISTNREAAFNSQKTLRLSRPDLNERVKVL